MKRFLGERCIHVRSMFLLITCVANLLFGIGLLVPGSKALAVAIINCCVRSPSIFDNFRGNQTKPNPLLSYLSGLDYVCDAGYVQRVIKSRVCFFLYDRLHSRFTRERLRLLLQGIKVTQSAARSTIEKHKRVRASAREKR